MKQRLGLVQAFMENPDVILLDEPFNALDENNFKVALEQMKEEKEKGKIIVVASHSLNDEQVKCFDRVINIEEGTIRQ
ncbi:hypothetical protein [Eubacterium oxidoreducens]|uniref:ABC-2 type transport system ATP-binding protein n=1 Tax=Eubacterium oxidoreducens TaxID=1732 RepID=A0A1G6BXH7_EUBOX|nr:hypothetical protein [Eubacterium oxidoreducens]SDB25314.1 ABC-2 type transport system ATP-binding protein [Eubacterium oxidoreducens]